MIRDEVKSYQQSSPTKLGLNAASANRGVVPVQPMDRSPSSAMASAPDKDTKSRIDASSVNGPPLLERQHSGGGGIAGGSAIAPGPSSQAMTAARSRQMSINHVAATDDRAAFHARGREDDEEDIFEERREKAIQREKREQEEEQEQVIRKGTVQSAAAAAATSHALYGSSGYVSSTSRRENEPAAGASPTETEIASSNAASAQDSSLSSRVAKQSSSSLVDKSGLRNAALSRTSSSGNKTPSTPSPGKMQSVAKAERKQKRIFFLQSMQRRKAEGDESSASSSLLVQSNATTAAAAAKFLDVKGVRAGGVGYSLTDHHPYPQAVIGGEPPIKRSNARGVSLGGAGVPPLPVDFATQKRDAGLYSGDDQELDALKQARLAQSGVSSDVSNLFSQFQSSSFSAREGGSSSAYLEPNNQQLKPVVSRQLNTAPVVVQKRSRFPTLRGGKLGLL